MKTFIILDENKNAVKTFESEGINKDEVLRNYPIGYTIVQKKDK